MFVAKKDQAWPRLPCFSRPRFLGNPGIEGCSRESRAFAAKEAAKARPWPRLPCFSRPRFCGKRGKKPGKTGQAGLCQAYRAFDRAPDARDTLCFELMWSSSDVKSIFLNGVSSIETVHNVKKKTLFSRKYSRLICQFTKSQNAYNNYLFIDIEIKLNAGVSYPSKFQTYFVIYGVVSLQLDIIPGLYDALYFIENGLVYFNKEIDMQGNKIVGLGDNINDNSGAVNLKQLNTAISTSKKDINDSTVTLIKTLQPKSYYTEIFETYFDITDPNNFIVDDTYGAEVKYVKCQNDNGYITTEYMKDDFDLSLFDKQLGTVLNGSVISLRKTISTNKYTIFISFKHNTTFTDATKNLVGFGGITNDKKITYSDPRYSINNQKLIIDNQNDNNHQLSVLSQYQNKNLFMWIMKNGNNVRYGLVNGAYLDKTVNVRSVTTRNIIIELPYKIKRIGISTNAYSFSSTHIDDEGSGTKKKQDI